MVVASQFNTTKHFWEQSDEEREFYVGLAKFLELETLRLTLRSNTNLILLEKQWSSHKPSMDKSQILFSPRTS